MSGVTEVHALDIFVYIDFDDLYNNVRNCEGSLKIKNTGRGCDTLICSMGFGGQGSHSNGDILIR